MDKNEGLTFDMIGNMSSEELDNFENTDSNSELTFDNIVSDTTIENSTEEEEENAILDFSQEGSEGGDGGSQEDEENPLEDKSGTSPNFYASIATSLKTDGLLNLLDESDFNEISDASDLAGLFQKQINNMLDEKNRRIDDALNNNIPVDIVKQYENTLELVNSFTSEVLKEETKEAEKMRGEILVQDYMNKGFSIERANREAQKSFDAGTDIDDAILAVQDLKKFYSEGYDKVRNEAKTVRENKLKGEKEQIKILEKKFLNTEEPIKGVKLNKAERDKLYKQFTTFVDKDEQGNPLNAIQKYAKENPSEYQYIINTLYYLTDGFKELNKVVGKEVKNRTKSALSDLEKTLRNPNSSIGTGGLEFGNDKSPDSFKGLTLALD